MITYIVNTQGHVHGGLGGWGGGRTVRGEGRLSFNCDRKPGPPALMSQFGRKTEHSASRGRVPERGGELPLVSVEEESSVVQLLLLASLVGVCVQTAGDNPSATCCPVCLQAKKV